MKKLFIVFALLLCFSSLKAQSYFYAVDTLKAGDSTKTYILNGKYDYVTVTAKSESGAGVIDSLYAFNVFNITSPVKLKGISDATDGNIGVVPSGASLNYFLWDPYIGTLKIIRTTRVWASGWKLILTVKAITRL
jgi:hypothetical protein